MAQANNPQTDYWQLAYLTVPAVIGGLLSRYLASDFMLNVIYGGLLGIVGALSGWAVHRLMASRGTALKAAGLAAVLGLWLAVASFIPTLF